MQITNSDVSLASHYQRVTVDRSSASVRTWRERPATQSLPDQARGNAYGHDRAHEHDCHNRTDRCDELEDTSGDYRLTMTRMLVEYFGGSHVDVLDSADFEVHANPDAAGAATSTPPAPAPRDPRGELVIAIDVESTHFEREAAAFAARGRVQTGDGRTIDFAVDMALERESLEHMELYIRAGAAVRKDPLALSLDGSAPRLTDDKVAFDIDADGVADRPPSSLQPPPSSPWTATSTARSTTARSSSAPAAQTASPSWPRSTTTATAGSTRTTRRSKSCCCGSARPTAHARCRRCARPTSARSTRARRRRRSSCTAGGGRTRRGALVRRVPARPGRYRRGAADRTAGLIAASQGALPRRAGRRGVVAPPAPAAPRLSPSQGPTLTRARAGGNINSWWTDCYELLTGADGSTSMAGAAGRNRIDEAWAVEAEGVTDRHTESRLGRCRPIMDGVIDRQP